MSHLITDQVVAAVGAAVVAGLVTLISMHIKFRREDAKEREAQRAQDAQEREAERAKRARDGELLRQALEKIESIDRSVNNREEPVTKQLDRIEQKQGQVAEKLSQHSRDINGVRRDINLMHSDIGTLHQTDRRITEGLVEVREEQALIHRILDKMGVGEGPPPTKEG